MKKLMMIIAMTLLSFSTWANPNEVDRWLGRATVKDPGCQKYLARKWSLFKSLNYELTMEGARRCPAPTYAVSWTEIEETFVCENSVASIEATFYCEIPF